MTAKDQTGKQDQIKEKKVITVGYREKKLLKGLKRVLSYETPDLVNSDQRIKRKDYFQSGICVSKSSKLGGSKDE